MTAVALSPTQRAVLAAIIVAGDDGWPVSVREIQRLSGVGATSTVHRALEELYERGLVTRNPRNDRGGIWKPLVDAVPEDA